MEDIIQTTLVTAGQETIDLISQPSSLRSVVILFASILLAFWLSRFLSKGIIFVAQKVAVQSDNESREDRFLLYRQVETYLSVTVAAVRAVVVAVVAYIMWRILSPEESQRITESGAAAIGAGTFFIVFAGQTLGLILRDITVGAAMIIEKWFHVGDFIKVEPFIDVSGVVERLTLRSTKLRSLNGEVIWINNQQIQAVHVTPRGVITMAVDVFVRDQVQAQDAIQKVMDSIPKGPTMLARPLRMKEAEKWGEDLWRITVVGQTPPGREWLIEQYFVNAIKDIDHDKEHRKDYLIVQEPIARYADPVADRKFKRAVRAQRS